MIVDLHNHAELSRNTSHAWEMLRTGTRSTSKIESVSDLVREIKLGRCEPVRIPSRNPFLVK